MSCIFDTAQGKISIGLGKIPQVVEFVDPTLIARTGPKLGYTLLYQPAGIRAIATGKMGNWVRLKLSEDEDAWVEEDSIKFLKLGTPVPHSFITFIRTQKLDGKTQVEIQLSLDIFAHAGAKPLRDAEQTADSGNSGHVGTS